MAFKYKILILLMSLLASFSIGRYTSRPADTSKKETTETDINKDSSQDIHKITIIVKDPDGKETTTITEDTESREKETQKTVEKLVEESKSRRDLINVSVLASTEFGKVQPILGFSANKELIGPITVGAFGFVNGVVGLSVGVNF